MSTIPNPVFTREELLRLLKNEFLIVKEVVYVTGVCRTQIWKLVKCGKLTRCPNTGRKVLFTAQAVMECFTPKRFKNKK